MAINVDEAAALDGWVEAFERIAETLADDKKRQLKLKVAKDQGIETILVEKEPTIGGVMAQLNKTFPTMDCSI